MEAGSNHDCSTPIKIGFFLGGMSGPGSGAHTRMLSLVEALATENVELFVNGSSQQLKGFSEAPNVHLRSMKGSSVLARYFNTHRRARQFIKRDELDFLQFETLPFPRSLRCKLLFNIHHLVPLQKWSLSSPLKWLKQSIRNTALSRAARRAHRVVTLTEWSKSDIASRFGLPVNDVVAIPFGFSTWPKPLLTDNNGNGGLHFQKYVLALGHLEERKNLKILVQALASPEWPRDIPLVLAGKDHGQRENLELLATELGVEVVFTGLVDDSTKTVLLSDALCLAMPSVLEGFGIPIVEAIATGTPALVSDCTALPEVVGVPEAVLDANNPLQWARVIRQLAESEEQRMSLLLKQQSKLDRYSAKRVAEKYLNRVLFAQNNGEDRCDILHLAYGGLGGHRAVIEELSSALSVTPLVSKALLLAPLSQDQEWGDTKGLRQILTSVVRRRADLTSMIDVFKKTYRLRPKVIIAHTHRHIPAAWLGSLFSRKWPRIVLVEHQSLKLRSMSDNVNSAIGLLLSRAVVFLTPTYRDSYTLNRLVMALRKTTSIIPNGIGVPEEFKTWPRTENDYLIIGMASRLIPQKEIANLIQAVAILNQEGDFRLRIAGDGPDKERLIELTLHLGLEDQVFFDGEIGRSQMKDWYLSLDIYAQISSGETMSMSVLEAASLGLPIFSSNSPGIRDVFRTNRAAVIFDNNSPQEIASRVMSVAQNGLLDSYGAEARRSIFAQHNNRKMAEGYLRLLAKISKNSGVNFTTAIRQVEG